MNNTGKWVLLNQLNNKLDTTLSKKDEAAEAASVGEAIKSTIYIGETEPEENEFTKIWINNLDDSTDSPSYNPPSSWEDSRIGNLEDLTTNNKNNIVSAINEVNAKETISSGQNEYKGTRYINIANYGIVPNGKAAENSNKLNQLLTSISGIKNRCILYIPTGDWYFSEPWNFSAGSNILGIIGDASPVYGYCATNLMFEKLTDGQAAITMISGTIENVCISSGSGKYYDIELYGAKDPDTNKIANKNYYKIEEHKADGTYYGLILDGSSFAKNVAVKNFTYGIYVKTGNNSVSAGCYAYRCRTGYVIENDCYLTEPKATHCMVGIETRGNLAHIVNARGDSLGKHLIHSFNGGLDIMGLDGDYCLGSLIHYGHNTNDPYTQYTGTSIGAVYGIRGRAAVENSYLSTNSYTMLNKDTEYCSLISFEKGTEWHGGILEFSKSEPTSPIDGNKTYKSTIAELCIPENTLVEGVKIISANISWENADVDSIKSQHIRNDNTSKDKNGIYGEYIVDNGYTTIKIVQKANKILEIEDAFIDDNNKVGELSNLNTINKNDVVSALNEINGKVGNSTTGNVMDKGVRTFDAKLDIGLIADSSAAAANNSTKLNEFIASSTGMRLYRTAIHFGSGDWYFAVPITIGAGKCACIFGDATPTADCMPTNLIFNSLSGGQTAISGAGLTLANLTITGSTNRYDLQIDRTKILEDPPDNVCTESGADVAVDDESNRTTGIDISGSTMSHDVVIKNFYNGAIIRTGNMTVTRLISRACHTGLITYADAYIVDYRAYRCMKGWEMRAQSTHGRGIRGDSIGDCLVHAWYGRFMLTDLDCDWSLGPAVRIGVDNIGTKINGFIIDNMIARCCLKNTVINGQLFDASSATTDDIAWIYIAKQATVHGGRVTIANPNPIDYQDKDPSRSSLSNELYIPADTCVDGLTLVTPRSDWSGITAENVRKYHIRNDNKTRTFNGRYGCIMIDTGYDKLRLIQNSDGSSTLQPAFSGNIGNTIPTIIAAYNTKDEIPDTTQAWVMMDEETPIPGSNTAEEAIAYLPNVIYAAVGRTIEIYNKQVCINVDKYHVQWICNKGKAYARKFTITPTESDIGETPLTLNIYDDKLKIIYTKTSTIKIINGNINDNITILPIGDSLTNSKPWLAEITTLSEGKLTYVGTRRNGAIQDSFGKNYAANTLRHEGRGGYTAAKYMSDSTYTLDSFYVGVSSVDGATNPFWDGNKFSLRHYLTTQNIDEPSAIQIWLGTNDINNGYETAITDISALISNIRAEYPTIKILLCNTIYRGGQNGYPEDATKPISWEYDYNNRVLQLMKALTQSLKEDQNIYFIPLAVCHDSEYNFGATEIPVNPRATQKEFIPIGSIHPQPQGYYQCADELFSAYCAIF